MTVRTLVRDINKKVERKLSKSDRDKVKRERAKSKKIDYLIRRFDNLPTDTIEGWVDEDFELLDTLDDESEQFCNDLSESINLDIKATGSRWHSYHKPLGRFIETIRKGCSENDSTTILVIRGHDKTVYRLGVKRGKENGLLHSAIKEGYILSKVYISQVDEEKI